MPQVRENMPKCVQVAIVPPGMPASDIGPALSLQASDLTKRPVQDAAETFWIIKHGIKMMGMPAWDKSDDDHTYGISLLS
ncbi:hypothetical protein [Herbaspirillum sp. ST 5-3]|uniref:hypothetical protein n=1 Tax=Oxalobacteraceae TaxID=75682 RepID=UPI0010A44A8F|nr:hypothetical protein [Herbaspirillum sp. ST 5-3]